jgi:hypothetical protein
MPHRKKPPKVIVADVSGSTCFADLRWKDGVAYATFARDGSQYEFDVDRDTFNEWASDGSLGGWYNSELG